MWSKQHKGLACRLVCDRQAVRPGEVFSLSFDLKNTGVAAIIIPLYLFDGKSRLLAVSSDEAIGSTRTCVSISSDTHGDLMFDNFGYRAYMPETTYAEIAPGEVFSTAIVIDDSSTFTIKRGDDVELFGGVDHCGLTMRGTYRFKVELSLANSETEHWSGRLETNEISVIVTN